jgi:hypothetical protein
MRQFLDNDSRARTKRDGLIMANQLTDEQETLLANMVEQARDRARMVWKASVAHDLVSDDEAFDSGFESAIDFAFSDEFEHFISRIKSMLGESGTTSH